MADEKLVPQSPLDYGSGYTVSGGCYYAGGIPQDGLWLGHANNQPRNDRVLVKYPISPYVLRSKPVASAKLYFNISTFVGARYVFDLELAHLTYDAKRFSVKELLTPEVETVGNLLVKRDEFTGKEYSIDVTRYVNDDIAKGKMYSSFRLRNVTAEMKGNLHDSRVGVLLGDLSCKPLPYLEIKDKDMVIVENGKPNAVIIVNADAPNSVQRAAVDLQGYMEKVTGAKLLIQHAPIPQGQPGVNIFLGESAFTKALGLNLAGLKSDGFKIVSGDNWLAILGRDYPGKPIASAFGDPWDITEVYNNNVKTGAFGETGTLYGVYRFLEEYCGVRWYLPGELGTVIPKMETLKLEPVNYQKSPDFTYRNPFCLYFPQSNEDALWYRRAGFGAASPVQIIDSFRFFLKYKDTHPEYFALIGGQRDFTALSCETGGGNLCLSNPEVAKQWIADIRDYFDKNPEQSTFPIMPNDGMRKICECPKCQEQIDRSAPATGMFSNYVWNFINNVAKEVYKTHPEKIIGCCSYEHYGEPPTNLNKLSPNVAVMITKTRGSYNNKENQENTKEKILAWREKASIIYTWEYYLWYLIRPWNGLPIIFPHIISDDLKFLKGISNGEFIESQSWMSGESKQMINYPGMQHINLYVTAKTLWDANLDVDKLMNDYYEKFYGPASGEMKGFWTLSEKIWMTPPPQGAGDRAAWNNPGNFYTKDNLDKLFAFLENARLKTPENSIYRKRVELIRAEFLPAQRKLTNPLVLNPPQVTVAGPDSAINVDGVLDDASWGKKIPMVFVDKEGETANYKTVAYTAWDEDNLYFAFVNDEPDMSKLLTRATTRDQSYAPWVDEDDSVEIFISPNVNDRAKCYHFIVNAKGVIWDAIHHPNGSADSKWNGDGFRVKTKIEGNRWIVETKIPFKEIGIEPPVNGKRIAVNLCRNRRCGQPVVYSGWSPTINLEHFSPARFGQIIFKRK